MLVLFLCINTTAAFPHESRLQVRYDFAFDPYPDARAQVVNEVLKTIAEGSGKLRVFTSYSLHAYLTVKMEVSGEQIMYRLIADTMYLSGDTQYRDFCLKQVLMPDKADLWLEFTDKAGNIVYDTKISALGFETGKAGLSAEAFPVLRGMDPPVNVSLKAASFYYDQRMLQRMEEWNLALASYYEAPASIQTAHELIRGVDLSNPETLLLDEFGLCEAEALMGEVRYASFHEWLGLDNNDPEKVLPALAQLQIQLDSLRVGFNASIMQIDELFYQQGLRAICDELPLKARESFYSAIVYNPFHIPSHLALVKADMGDMELRHALTRLGRILSVMYPQRDLKESTNQLADTMLGLFFSESRELIAEDRLTESLEILTFVERFCHETEGFYDRPVELNTLLSKTHQGIYRSFITVSERALRNNDPVFAEKYLESAIAYQQTNHLYVPDHDLALDLIFGVIASFCKQSEKLKDEHGPETAAHILSLARDVDLKYPALFPYLANAMPFASMAEGVLCYAKIGLPGRSTELLLAIRDRINPPQNDVLMQLQHDAGVSSAKYYREHHKEPILVDDLLDEITGRDPWLTSFRQAFLETWK